MAGTSQLKSMKHRIAGLDKENFTYSLIEGDTLMADLESITYHVKFVPSADGGSICNNRSIYHTKGDAAEEQIKAGKDKAMASISALISAFSVSSRLTAAFARSTWPLAFLRAFSISESLFIVGSSGVGFPCFSRWVSSLSILSIFSSVRSLLSFLAACIAFWWASSTDMAASRPA
ncbi:hypothetical protein RJ640_022065 [Escallonia rubra]|uniref:Bet v I/Major latex protein domain-containing protein n=1 Tax=Escallonia rubra TaxID=112253 RepID=A0AA88UH75_9ASTE|nr:hypothetical protein RJ640_022065 [Escallonia rubra]